MNSGTPKRTLLSQALMTVCYLSRHQQSLLVSAAPATPGTASEPRFRLEAFVPVPYVIMQILSRLGKMQDSG
jgi:hypothetical protein